MLLSSEDSRKYPDLFYWIFYTLANLPYIKPKVFSAYEKFAGKFLGPISWRLENHPELHWGTLPYLEINFSDMTVCQDDGEEKIGDNRFVMRRSIHWYGFTPPNYASNKIIVAGDLVAGLPDPQVERVLEATVLHELIHWTRLKAGLDVADETPSYDFETQAYGDHVHRTWKSCFEQEYYYVPPR